MAANRGVAWVLFLVLSIVLAITASSVYYWSKHGGDSEAHPVPELSMTGGGGEALPDTTRLPVAAEGADSGNLPVATQSAASSAPVRNALPPLSLHPRRAVEAALQSGSPTDAFVAAQAIYRCRYLTGASQMALEKVHERGIRAAPKELSEFMSPIESAERMCQELDDSMKAQYEPMLRKAMEAGLHGAAARWWVTPEAKAMRDAPVRTAALELLRRDARQCDLSSLGTYKVAAYQFYDEFDANEVAAVYAASAQLHESKKLRDNHLDKLMERFTPWHAIRIQIGVDRNVVKTMTAKILSSCE